MNAGRACLDPAASDSPGAAVIAEPLSDGTVSIGPFVHTDPAQVAELFHRVSAGMQEFIDAFGETMQAISVTLRPWAELLERERARAEVAAIEADARLAFRAAGDRCAPLAGMRFDVSGLPVDDGPEEW